MNVARNCRHATVIYHLSENLLHISTRHVNITVSSLRLYALKNNLGKQPQKVNPTGCFHLLFV